eukprot:2597600-Prymnesium_polylepis.1
MLASSCTCVCNALYLKIATWTCGSQLWVVVRQPKSWADSPTEHTAMVRLAAPSRAAAACKAGRLAHAPLARAPCRASPRESGSPPRRRWRRSGSRPTRATWRMRSRPSWVANGRRARCARCSSRSRARRPMPRPSSTSPSSTQPSSPRCRCQRVSSLS